MTGKTILLVEDNPKVMRNNKTLLKLRGAVVLTAETLAEARPLLNAEIDAAVIDITLPDGSGLSLLREIRAASDDVSTLPVLFLTAMGETSDIVNGLAAGADDYLAKPYDLNVLAARLEALLRRTRTVADRVRIGGLYLDLVSGTALYEGEGGSRDMLMTQKEFSLLFLLVQNEGKLVTAKYLYEKVWGQPFDENNTQLRVHISNLKKKLSETEAKILIETSRGEGYSLKRL